MTALMANPRVRSAAEVFGPGLVIVIGTILIFGVSPIAEPGVYVISLFCHNTWVSDTTVTLH